MATVKSIKGAKVYLPELKKVGTAHRIDPDGIITEVLIDGQIVQTAENIVKLWDLLSWFYKLIINLFLKKSTVE